MGWGNRHCAVPTSREPSAEDIVKRTQTIVHAYSNLIAESGTNLPESALPHPKEAVRSALLLWAALEDAPETRARLCSLYGMLEDFLPHDEWQILHEWHGILETRDMDAWLRTDPRFRETAVRLMNETMERGTRRMQEFKERLGDVSAWPTRRHAPGGLIVAELTERSVR